MAQSDTYIWISVALIGLGTAASLGRRSVVPVLAGFMVSAFGTILLACLLDSGDGASSNLLAIAILCLLNLNLLMGLIVAMRRFRFAGRSNIDEDMRLKH
jgi:hypothetical protein